MNVAKKQNARTEKASIFTSPRMRRLVWLRLYRNRYIYLMILPVIVYFILLKYVPMWFLRSAFYDYKLRLGFDGSKYVGLKYFERLFTNPNLLNYIGNTLKLNIAALVILFPMPVIFAIMLNEMRNVKFMKFVQTISYLPHFVSTVVLVSMITTIVSPSIGSLARLTKLMGGTPINYLSIPEYFVPINVISGLWQGVGWGAVIYVSTLAGIDRVLYEAAKIDGANRWQQILHVSLPGLAQTFVLMLIMQVGQLLNVNFEKVYLLQNTLNLSASEMLPTFVYKTGMEKPQLWLRHRCGVVQLGDQRAAGAVCQHCQQPGQQDLAILRKGGRYHGTDRDCYRTEKAAPRRIHPPHAGGKNCRRDLERGDDPAALLLSVSAAEHDFHFPERRVCGAPGRRNVLSHWLQSPGI